jgi:hypothetical protein
MAQFQHLPIYKHTVDLLGVVVELTKHMPRDFKASIGGEVRTAIVRIVVLIGRANAATAMARRAEHIDELLEHLQAVELLLRVSRDQQFISTSQWSRTAELTASIGKQAGGWRKLSRNAAAPVA